MLCSELYCANHKKAPLVLEKQAALRDKLSVLVKKKLY